MGEKRKSLLFFDNLLFYVRTEGGKEVFLSGDLRILLLFPKKNAIPSLIRAFF